MFRRLVIASAVFLGLLPSAAGAIALGGLRSQSGFNEPFAGQIELLDVEPDEIDTVKVLLASEDEFNKVGAPRPSFLTGLRFTPAVTPQGSPVILIAGTEPVREPYVDFLIEVTSPVGRIVKEYTALLDPPVTMDGPLPQVEPPVIESSASQQALREGARPWRGRAPVPSPADTPSFPMVYGPVKPGDGLWRVARKMAISSGASGVQTAMALYRNNQQSFIRGDINRLKVGTVLKIPTSAELLALDHEDAAREFDAALRGRSVTSAPLTDTVAAPEPADRLKIASAAEPVSPTLARSEAPPDARRPVEIAEREGAAAGAAEGQIAADRSDRTGADLGAIEQDLLLVQEIGESTRQETTELRDRIRGLETQLADIQRLLKLSNERFAQLQAARRELPEGLALDGIDDPQADGSVMAADAPDVSDRRKSAVAPTSSAAPSAEPEPDAGAGASTTDPVTAPNAWGSIPWPMSAFAAAILLPLLVLGWMIYKRQNRTGTLEPGELTSEASGVERAPAPPADSLAAGHSTEEAADVSAAMRSPYGGFGNLQADSEEPDVISEADVYIAYGRYREAQSLLEEEQAKSPDRLDVKLKLAEVYYGAGNIAGMEVIMAQLQRFGVEPADADRWRRLDGMLRELKGVDAGGQGAPAAEAETHAGDAREPTQPSDTFFPPPPDPDSLEHGFPHAEGASTAESPTASSPDLTLDVEGLDVVSGSLQTATSDEMPEMSGAASDLELRLDDLESLRDLDLAHFTDQVSAAEPQSAETETDFSADADRQTLDIESTGQDFLAGDSQPSQWRIDSGMWDEVGTKIDLARAFVEMGNSSAARVILEEIEQGGNQEQRAEAKEMMGRLS